MARNAFTELPLKQLSRRHRQALLILDVEWPDSRALMARVAKRLRGAHPGEATEAAILAMMRAASEAYIRTCASAGEDYERFGATVDALTRALDRDQARYVAQSLSVRQRGYLARRLPPSEAPDVC